MKGTAEMLSNPPLWAEIVSGAEEGSTVAIDTAPAATFAGCEPAAQADLLVALFRIWARARSVNENPLPDMFDHAGDYATSPELVTACQSLFELTQACLGRPLSASSGTSTDLSADEQGIVALLDAAAQSGPKRTSHRIPHGLPGALTWAAYAVNRALATPLDKGVMATSCPFAQGAQH